MIRSQVIYPTEKKLGEFYESHGIPHEKVEELDAARNEYLDALEIAVEKKYIDDRVFNLLYGENSQSRYSNISRLFPYCEYSEIIFCREMRRVIDTPEADMKSIMIAAMEYEGVLDKIADMSFAGGKSWHRYLMERRYKTNIDHGIRSEHMALYDDQESDARLEKLLQLIEKRCNEEETASNLKSNLEVAYFGVKQIREKILNGESVTGRELEEGIQFYKNTMNEVKEVIGEDPYRVQVEPATRAVDFIPKKPEHAVRLDTAFSRYKEKFVEINAIIWEEQIKNRVHFGDRLVFDAAEKGFLKHQVEKRIKEALSVKPIEGPGQTGVEVGKTASVLNGTGGGHDGASGTVGRTVDDE